MPAVLPDQDGRLCVVEKHADGSLRIEHRDSSQETEAFRHIPDRDASRTAITRYLDAPTTCSSWRFSGCEYDLTSKVLVMGVLNCTPDSFYGGSRFPSVREAVDAGRAMIEAGVDIVDVGGESTRPRATPVEAEEECHRVLPVVESLAPLGRPVSIDTRRAGVAREALRAGATIINDVSGFRDPEMLAVLAESTAGAVVMHMQGDPATMQEDPQYQWVVGEVAAFLADALDRLVRVGVAEERAVLDPGIGFGKTLLHNIELLRRISDLMFLGRPVLVGVSRKSFIGQILGVPADERLEGSLAAACAAVLRGARIVRVHDVRETVRAMRVLERLL